VELAQKLEVERKTVQRWMKIDSNPGRSSDGRYNVRDWKTWAQAHGKARKTASAPDRTALECQRLLLGNQETEFDLAVKMGRYILLSDAAKTAGEFALTLKQMINAWPGQLAPDVVGLTIAEAEAKIRAHTTRLLTLLSEGPWLTPEV
jgi:hypothetical protein